MSTRDESQDPRAIGATATLAAFDDGLTSSRELTEEERAKREESLAEASRTLLRDLRRRDNLQRWQLACPMAMRESSWEHPGLSPFRACIDRVLGYQLNAKGILASGKTGRGKTRAMWQLMHRLGVVEGHDVRYWSATDWFSTLQEQIRYGRDEARGWVETVASRHIVFIDDFGQEAVQANREEWAQGWFFRFLDLRVGARLPLFMTTNLRSEEMSDRNGAVRGDPLVRRLVDLCEPITFATSEENSLREARLRKPRADIDG